MPIETPRTISGGNNQRTVGTSGTGQNLSSNSTGTMNSVDFGEKLVQNIKAHWLMLVFLVIGILSPYLLFGGQKSIGVDVPFGKTFDLFISSTIDKASGGGGTSDNNNGGSEALFDTNAAKKMPGIIKTGISFVFYTIATLLQMFLLFRIFMLIWPRE